MTYQQTDGQSADIFTKTFRDAVKWDQAVKLINVGKSSMCPEKTTPAPSTRTPAARGNPAAGGTLAGLRRWQRDKFPAVSFAVALAAVAFAAVAAAVTLDGRTHAMSHIVSRVPLWRSSERSACLKASAVFMTLVDRLAPSAHCFEVAGRRRGGRRA